MHVVFIYCYKCLSGLHVHSLQRLDGKKNLKPESQIQKRLTALIKNDLYLYLFLFSRLTTLEGMMEPESGGLDLQYRMALRQRVVRRYPLGISCPRICNVGGVWGAL